MNTFAIEDVVEDVTHRLHAVNGNGVNRAHGVYFRWRLVDGTSKSIWVSDTDFHSYTRAELAIGISFELSRRRE